MRSDSSSFPCSRAGGREIQWAAASAGSASSRGGGGGGRELQEGRRRPRVRALPPWPASCGGEGLAAGGGGAGGEEQAEECRALLAPAQWRSGGVRETGRGCGKRDASWAFKWAFSHSSHFMSTDLLFFFFCFNYLCMYSAKKKYLYMH